VWDTSRSLEDVLFFKGAMMELLSWTVLFLVIALVAGVLGFGGVAAGAADIARILFFIFIVLFIVALLRGL